MCAAVHSLVDTPGEVVVGGGGLLILVPLIYKYLKKLEQIYETVQKTFSDLLEPAASLKKQQEERAAE